MEMDADRDLYYIADIATDNYEIASEDSLPSPQTPGPSVHTPAALPTLPHRGSTGRSHRSVAWDYGATILNTGPRAVGWQRLY